MELATVPGEYGAAAARAAAVPFDAGVACSLLAAGDEDRGLRYVACNLDEREPPLGDPSWPELVRRLGSHPFVAASRARAYGYAGDPPVSDVAVGVGPAAPDPARRRDWLLEQSSICRGILRRTMRLAEEIDLAATREPGARVVGIAPGHAHELLFSSALRDERISASIVEPDGRAWWAATHLLGRLPVATRQASLSDVLGGTVRVPGCALVYVPTLAEHLPPDTLFDLLATLAGWLQTGGQVVVPFFTSLPEAGFLRWVADWRPNVLRPADVLARARELEGVVPRIEQEAAFGLAFLHLERIALPTSRAGARRAAP
jgi:hypothetical protein